MSTLRTLMPDWLRWAIILGLGFVVPAVVFVTVGWTGNWQSGDVSGWGILFVLGCWMLAGYVGGIDERARTRSR